MHLVPISRDEAPPPYGVRLPQVMTQVIEATLALYARRGYVEPWIGYLAVEGDEIIGACGFASPPTDGEAEIAYFTFPGLEGRGLATEMARSLLRASQSAAAASKIRFIAHTRPEEGPSTSILRKLGFVHSGAVNHPEDGLVWKWVLHAGAEVPST